MQPKNVDSNNLTLIAGEPALLLRGHCLFPQKQKKYVGVPYRSDGEIQQHPWPKFSQLGKAVPWIPQVTLK